MFENTNGSTYPENRWIMLISVALCPFMAQMNIGFMSVGLPSMAVAFEMPTSVVTWVAMIFPVMISAVVMFFGKLGDEAGHKRILKYGLILFTVGTLLCGLAQSFTSLIIFRVIQSIGAGAYVGNEHGTITKLFPSTELGRAFGINSSSVALGTLSGSFFGGLLLSAFSWRALFLVQAVACVPLIIFQTIILKSEKITKKIELDYLGAALFFVAIGGIFTALQQLHKLGFTHPLIIACLAVGVFCLVLFIIRQRKTSAPLFPRAVFSDKWFALSLVCLLLLNVLISTVNLVMPFYFQRALGYSAMISGFLLALPHLINAIVAPISGRISPSIGRGKTAFFGMLSILSGMIMLSFSSLSVVFIAVVGLVLFSSGNGLFQSPNNAIVMSSVDGAHIGIASSLNAFSRNLGNSLGTVAANAVLYAAMSQNFGSEVTSYIDGRPDVFMAGLRWVFVVAVALALVGASIALCRMRSGQDKKI